MKRMFLVISLALFWGLTALLVKRWNELNTE